jgi:hypothetical protein
MGDDYPAADKPELRKRTMSRRSFGAATVATGAILALPVAAQGEQPASITGRKNMAFDPVVRISISRCDAAQFDKLRQLMLESEATLRPGIERMPGNLAFYAGADPTCLTFTNISLWDTLEHAQQLDQFQPMLDAGKRFVAEGARFDRPIINSATLWRFGPMSDVK